MAGQRDMQVRTRRCGGGSSSSTHRFTRRGEPLLEFGSGHADVCMSRPGRSWRCIVRTRGASARRRDASDSRCGRRACQTLARRFHAHRFLARPARRFLNGRRRSRRARRQRGFIARGRHFTDRRDSRRSRLDGCVVRIDRHHDRRVDSPPRRRRNRRLIHRIPRRGTPAAVERVRARQPHRAQHEAGCQRQQRRLPAASSRTRLHPRLVVRTEIRRAHGSGYRCLARAVQIEYARPRPLALHERRASPPERRRQFGKGPRERQREMSGDVLHAHDVGGEPPTVLRTDSRYWM